MSRCPECGKECCGGSMAEEVERLEKALACHKEMDEAIAAGDAVLMTEQATLLRQCRAALDTLLAQKPMLSAMQYPCDKGSKSLGNLRAELSDRHPQGVFGVTPNARDNPTPLAGGRVD